VLGPQLAETFVWSVGPRRRFFQLLVVDGVVAGVVDQGHL